jgi:hypothetical protein
MKPQADMQAIYELIKKAVAEVFDDKILELKINSMPLADDLEMTEIDNIFVKPENYSKQEFVDIIL